MTVSARGRLVAGALAAAVLGGCGGGSAHAPVPASLPALSAAQLAGQRVIYSYQGLTPPAGLLTLIRHGEAAGVIFFGGNIASTAQIAGVISQLDQANASPDNPLRARPLLLMTDQEGGAVRRLLGPPLLSEKQIGASARRLPSSIHPSIKLSSAPAARQSSAACPLATYSGVSLINHDPFGRTIFYQK